MQQNPMPSHQAGPTKQAQSPATAYGAAGFGSAIDQIVLSIWSIIGLLFAAAAYFFAYDHLPSSIQLWLDPRLFALAVVFAFAGVAAALKGIRKAFSSTTNQP